MKIKIVPKQKKINFPQTGPYDYISKFGKGYFYPKDQVLYVPFIHTYNYGQGQGNKLLDELEQLVQNTPELNEIAFPTIINSILLYMVKKRDYSPRTEFFEAAHENIEVWFKTWK